MNKMFLMLITLAAANTFAATASTPATGTANSVAAPAAQTSSTTAAAVGATPKKIGFKYWQGTVFPARAANLGRAGSVVVSDSYVAPSMKLDEARSVEARQYILYNQTDATRNDEIAAGDLHLIYNNAKAYTLGNTPLFEQLRLVAPVSEFSQEVGKVEGRYTLSVEQALASKLTASYDVSTRVYGYTNEDDGQRGLRALAAATLKRDGRIAPYVAGTYDASWKHTGRALNLEGKRKYNSTPNSDVFTFDIGSEIEVNKNISFNIYAEQNRSLRAIDAYKFMNDDESIYILELTARM